MKNARSGVAFKKDPCNRKHLTLAKPEFTSAKPKSPTPPKDYYRIPQRFCTIFVYLGRCAIFHAISLLQSADLK
jgi:hypothetical protein